MMEEIIQKINREDNQRINQLAVQFSRHAQRDKSSVLCEDSTVDECSTDDSTTTSIEAMTDPFSSMPSSVDTGEQRLSEFAILEQGNTARRVSFHDVHVRVYEQVLSYNPACSTGAAIEIGWDYRTEQCLSVDEFERERPPTVAMPMLLLSKEDREEILGSRGYSAYDLASSERAILIAQHKRMKTIRRLAHEENKEQKKSERMRRFPFFRKCRQDTITLVET